MLSDSGKEMVAVEYGIGSPFDISFMKPEILNVYANENSSKK
jgi:hypothetical protein